MPSPDLRARLDLAVTAAREAGRITLHYFRRADLQVDRKQDDSPVTAADREAEQHLRRRIAATFPDDGILGEEFPEQPGTSGFRWVLDPIDGTKSFIHGVPLYSTLVGLQRGDESVLGVIVIPALDERVYAAIGQGAWYAHGDAPPQPARVSARSLSAGLFLTSEVANFEKVGRREAYDRLQAAARLARSWGDGYGYLMVATGRAEVMVDPVVSVWDVAALGPIIEEAGGAFSDWQGLRSTRSGNAVATNAAAQAEVMQILAGP